MHHNHGTVLRIRRTVYDQKIAEVDAGILHCIVLGNAEDGFFRISDQTCGQRILFCGIEIRADGCQRSKGFWFFCRKQIILALDNLFSDPGRTSELMQFFYQSCRQNDRGNFGSACVRTGLPARTSPFAAPTLFFCYCGRRFFHNVVSCFQIRQSTY